MVTLKSDNMNLGKRENSVTIAECGQGTTLASNP